MILITLLVIYLAMGCLVAFITAQAMSNVTVGHKFVIVLIVGWPMCILSFLVGKITNTKKS